MELNFNWDALQASSTLTYKITDISNTSSTLPTIETASTTAKVSINEIGQDYNFSFKLLIKTGWVRQPARPRPQLQVSFPDFIFIKIT